MQVIIIGSDRAEICKVKVRDLEKHYFTTRGQLYKVYPDGLTGLEIYDYTKNPDNPVKSFDEVIVYSENASIPYHPRRVSYDNDVLLYQIDQHKEMIGHGILSRGQLMFKQAANLWKALLPMLPMIVVGVILLWAFL